jgi:short-subunit dehydrogenase
MSGERGRCALVTGATSGIGKAFAERLARDGYDIILVGRRRARLEEIAAQLSADHGVATEVLTADLSRPEGVQRVADRVAAERALAMLVNNAGFTHLVPFTELGTQDIEDMIHVHTLALTRITHAALPGMLAAGRGDIINLSSDGIFVPYPSPVMAVYAATKAYTATFTRALHRLVGPQGLRVQALCTGYVKTEILERHGITFEDWNIPDSVVMSAEEQVNCSLAGLELGEVICVPTLDDPALLQRIEELMETVRERSSGTGVPAARYQEGDSPAAL